jgi:glucose-6-phosphate 1-dehydrogenase
MTGKCANLLIIFGATGDLAHRMLLPSLYGLQRDDLLPKDLRIIGTARSEMDTDAFRLSVAQTIEHRVDAGERDAASVRALLERIEYVAAAIDDEASMGKLAEAITKARNGDVVYHLSTAPRFYAPICEWLGQRGLGGPGTRVLLEKPIGHDLASSIAINDGVARIFDEDRVFRVDHYLGKEGVQNLISLRFGNALFEPLWNARHIEQVQITVAETVGVE